MWNRIKQLLVEFKRFNQFGVERNEKEVEVLLIRKKMFGKQK